MFSLMELTPPLKTEGPQLKSVQVWRWFEKTCWGLGATPIPGQGPELLLVAVIAEPPTAAGPAAATHARPAPGATASAVGVSGERPQAGLLLPPSPSAASSPYSSAAPGGRGCDKGGGP